ncbi:MAG TPA: transporter [Xanthobacteraceae bacterium]|nr:transporter [Xanthobacteraceae bacterium]
MKPKPNTLRSFVQNDDTLLAGSRAWFRLGTVFFSLFIVIAGASGDARADEDGVSFWIPGFFGSLAATPQQPGWSLAAINYYTDVSASGSAAVAREIRIGRFNPTINISVNANVHAKVELPMLIPTYVFATPFLGGHASASLLGLYGNNDSALNATFTAGPLTKSIGLQQTTSGFGDLIPQFAVRWNAGVNNYMTYLTGDIPVGKYSSTNLANIGLGHGALDGGVGYTYFDPQAGHEFSAVAGLTGNFRNPSTGYTSGLDFHLDWAAAQFLSKQVLVGVVGYLYDQITPDQGCAPIICPFESRVIGIGPQLGYIFPVGTMQGYFNIKGYGEFDNNARPDGWNLWLTFALSPAAPAAQSSPPPMLTKAPRG